MKRKKSGWDKLNDFIYGNFEQSLEYIKESKNYIWFSLILFFLASFIGYFFPVFFSEQILEMIRELIDKTEGLDGIELIRFIFLNNTQSSFFALFLGVFFGIIPFFILIVNGYVLGFVANIVVGEEGLFVLWKLLPHGIFEIPAVLISIGLGLRLGMFLLFYHGKGKWKEFKSWLNDSLRVFVFVVVPLLVIAAIIEGLLIYALG